MSYKLSMLLSLIFVVMFSLLAADMLIVQNTYSMLDNKSVNISYYLSKNGNVSNESINYIESTYNVKFELLSETNPAFGDNIIYNLSTTIHPFVIKDELNIVIQRMAVVGYYN